MGCIVIFDVVILFEFITCIAGHSTFTVYDLLSTQLKAQRAGQIGIKLCSMSSSR